MPAPHIYFIVDNNIKKKKTSIDIESASDKDFELIFLCIDVLGDQQREFGKQHNF